MEKSTASNDSSKSIDKASDSPNNTDAPEAEVNATPLRCFTGALTAGGLSLLAYKLTFAIATGYANKPILSENPVAVNISVAVRTLVMGMVALAAGVFGIAALGLTALGIQLLFKKATAGES